jgi:hypothetical protein
MALDESSDTSVSELKDQIAALQRQTFSLLLTLIVVSGTLTVYLYREASVIGKEMEAAKPQAEQIINTFNQNKNGMQNFVNQLGDYSKTHPEIQQLLARNGFGAAPAAAPPKK